MTDPRDDFDSPWKEALNRYLRPFLELLFPLIAAAIDWEAGYESLETELQQVAREASLGRREADTLFKIRRRNGEEACVLIHVEVQSQKDEDLAHRMFVYHYRLYDRYHLPLCSLAVLADGNPNWRSGHYEHRLWGCNCRLDFPVAKLEDLRPRLVDLEASRNPFATFVAAHLHAQGTTRNRAERWPHLWRLVRGLYKRDLSRVDVLELFRLVTWVLTLPEELNRAFHRGLLEYEKEIQMPFLSRWEREAMEEGYDKGLQEGRQAGRQEGRQAGRQEGRHGALQEALRSVLRARFQTLPPTLDEALEQIRDPDRLQALTARAATVESIEGFEKELAAQR